MIALDEEVIAIEFDCKRWPSDENDWFITWEVFCPVIRLDPVVGISLESYNGATLVKWSSNVTSYDTMWELKESWME